MAQNLKRLEIITNKIGARLADPKVRAAGLTVPMVREAIGLMADQHQANEAIGAVLVDLSAEVAALRAQIEARQAA